MEKINLGRKDFDLLVKIAILLFALLTLYASPLISFYFIIFIFIFTNVDFATRFPLSIIMVISGAMIFSSRELGVVTGDDFYNQYYPLYLNILNGGHVFTNEFGGGVEVGLAFFFKVISISGIRDPSYVLFCISFFTLFLFYLWLELFAFENIENSKTLLIASTFAFVGLFTITQLTRQAMAMVFVMYAISFFYRGRYLYFTISLLLGVLFHLTAIPIFVITYVFMYGTISNKNKIAIVIILFSLLFHFIVAKIVGSGLFWGVQSKFAYYEYNDLATQSSYYLRHLVVSSIILLVLNRKEILNNRYLSLLLYGTVAYVALLPIPFASDRMLMPLTTYLLGFVICLVFNRVSILYKLLLLTYCIFRFIQLGPAYDETCRNAIFCLWYSYPWLGTIFN